MSITPSGKQIRAARALAGWERTDLANKSGLSSVTIRYIENETNSAKKETIEKIIHSFRNVGIEFTENDGVRRLPIGIEIFEGLDRFEHFLNFMYDYLTHFGGEICISITDERYLQRTRKSIDVHRTKMTDLVNSGKVSGRILAAEGNFIYTWAALRRQHVSSEMPQVSFFAFGDNLALISFDHQKSPYVVLHKSGPFATAYKNAFDASWDKAEIVHE